MRVELFKDGAGEWRWRVRATNGSDILASSAEGYKNRIDCEHGLLLVSKLLSMPDAGVMTINSSGERSLVTLQMLADEHPRRTFTGNV